MATVYKAFDAKLERHVALKIIRTDIGQGTDMLKRFEREAKALAQLTHPNIVHIDDYGDQNGMPYVVMDYLPGGTLKQKLGHPMPYDEAARLLAPIARALEYAHQQKIVHRDVKPANILLTESGAPMLTDFGIAKILESKKQLTELTGTGVGLGTPDYMAPEQWFGKAEARTDIYALGIVFYELVTGRRPFTADTPAAVLLKHMNDPLPDPRQFVNDLPGRAEQVLLKALAKNVDDRYQTMGEFAAALERLSAPVRTDRTQMASPLLGAAAATVLIPATSGAATAAQGLSQSQSMVRPQPLSQSAIRVPTPVQPIAQPNPSTQSQGGLSRNALIAVGAAALLVLCLVGGVAGGAFLFSQVNPGRATASATAVLLAGTALPEPTPAPTTDVQSALATAEPTATATTTSPTVAPSDTATTVPPAAAATLALPTRTWTPVPPTRTWTPVPPTHTATHVPPTATHIPTNTPAPLVPTATPFHIIIHPILTAPILKILIPTPTPTFSLIIIHPIFPIIQP